jgi:Fur family transcriptional regulator, ferric uptake regulator
MSCLNILKQKGFRLTRQRRLIVEFIHDAHEHFSADDIISYVKQRMPKVNKSTVYRTLETLEQAGSVYKSESSDRCVYHHAEEGHHHHMVCNKCGKTEECFENLFSPIKKSLSDKYGFQANFQHQIITGLCRQCQIRAK